MTKTNSELLSEGSSLSNQVGLYEAYKWNKSTQDKFIIPGQIDGRILEIWNDYQRWDCDIEDKKIEDIVLVNIIPLYQDDRDKFFEFLTRLREDINKKIDKLFKSNSACVLGSSKSKRKAKASRENGKKGGRPKKSI